MNQNYVFAPKKPNYSDYYWAWWVQYPQVRIHCIGKYMWVKEKAWRNVWADLSFPLRPSEHREKHLIPRNFCILSKKWISVFIEHHYENGWRLYGLLNIQKGKKRKWHSSNSVMIIFWCTCRTILYSQSCYGHRRENGYCHDDTKCHDCGQSTWSRHLSTSRMESIFMLSC